MPQLRAFAICPTCCELHPSFRGCPECDGEPEVHGPTVAAVAEPEVPLPPVEVAEACPEYVRGPNAVPYIAALSVGVVVACGVLMALISG